jgi:hypothetical protein
MEIEQLRNLYLKKILKHINKVNGELTLFNQSKEYTGGSNATDPVATVATDTQKSLVEITNNTLKFAAYDTKPFEIIKKLKLELDAQKNNATELTKSTGELNTQIQTILKETINGLFNKNKELIDFYYLLSVDVNEKINKISEEIKYIKTDYIYQPITTGDIKTKYDEILNKSVTAMTQILYKLSNNSSELINNFTTNLTDIINDAKQYYDKLLTQHDNLINDRTTLLDEYVQSK